MSENHADSKFIRRSGDEAQRANFEMFSAATGGKDWDEITRIATGRPRIGEVRHQPVLKIRLGERLAKDLEDYLRTHPEQQKSTIVREALARCLEDAR